jgi:hypothetical protein
MARYRYDTAAVTARDIPDGEPGSAEAERCTMAMSETREFRAEHDQFLAQVQAHHQAGDYYPDPTIIGTELSLTPAQTEMILRDLRQRGWIAASPYDPARLRLTPRCWNAMLMADRLVAA